MRKTIGYHRFDTEVCHAALAEVYRHTNPLTKFWHPSVNIIAKQKLPNGRYKKSMTNRRLRRNASWNTPAFPIRSKNSCAGCELKQTRSF